MQTPFSQSNQDFSDRAHFNAQTQVYPYAINADQASLSFRCTSLSVGAKEKVLDGEMGVDRMVEVSCEQMRKPITLCVQERFRNVKYRGYQDLTITTWNRKTNKPSELYKINAGLFLYGFFDEEIEQVVEWVMVNTTDMLLALSSNRIDYDTKVNPRSGQEFIGISFQDLYMCNAMVACVIDGKHWSRWDV